MFLKREIFTVVGTLFLLSFLIPGCGGGSGANKPIQSSSLTETVFGQYGSKLEVDLPFPLKPEKVEFPEELQLLVTGTERYRGKEKSLDIDVLGIRYNDKKMPTNWTPDLEGAADRVKDNFSKIPGIMDFTSSKKPMSISGRPALLMTITYFDTKKTNEIKQLFVADGHAVWAVSISYSQNDQISNRLAQQVLQSIALK